MHASITGIEFHLPENTLDTRDLAVRFPDWRVDQIDAKTGIQRRHIAGEDECASDLAVAAVEKLFASGLCSPDEIDFVLLCTQSPDYALPTTACLIQQRLGIPPSVGALDFNLGCSGFIYGLGLAEGLVTSAQADSVLLITAETYSKYIGATDKNALTIFSDGAAATLISAQQSEFPLIGPFIYGTDGNGGKSLIVPDSGARRFGSRPDLSVESKSTKSLCRRQLFMDGNRILEFMLKNVPEAVLALSKKAAISLSSIDLFVFHQANAYFLEELRRILNIPAEKFQIAISCGNTVSSTIPIALKAADQEGRLVKGSLIMLIGFGVGYSWGATIVRWDGNQYH